MARRSAVPTADLEALADRYWDSYLAYRPFEAAAAGDRRFEGRVPDLSATARRRRLSQLKEFADQIGPPATAATPQEVALLENLRGQIQAERARLSTSLWSWTLDHYFGPALELARLPELAPVVDCAGALGYLKTWQQAAAMLATFQANLANSAAAGRVASAPGVNRFLAQLEAILVAPDGSSSLSAPARNARLTTSERRWFRRELARATKDSLRPALVSLSGFVKKVIRPVARPADSPGLASLRGGAADYRALIAAHTSFDLEPRSVHELGRTELARIEAEVSRRGQALYGLPDPTEIFERLRSAKVARPLSAQELLDSAERALGRATAALPSLLGAVPGLGCEVATMPAHEAVGNGTAYYQPPSLDLARGGVYYVNTTPGLIAPYEIEALTYHESVPGHHLQAARAARSSLPAFARFLGSTAFQEGWGLYAERLAGEARLYSDAEAELGAMAYDAWRTARLVVDTGLHHFGWSRSRSIEYLRTHSSLPEAMVEIEVDRFIVMPGQALAYKIGQLAISGYRAALGQALGDAFDLRRFHDVVLGCGAPPPARLGAILRAHLGIDVSSGNAIGPTWIGLGGRGRL